MEPSTTLRTARGRATGALLPDELQLGAVSLRVTDAERSARFYEQVLGLIRHADAPDGAIRLGAADGDVSVELLVDPALKPARRHAGLYHVALLYPSRIELARVVQRIAATETPVQGASDHGSHEAIYLADPDGNGLELAADRPEAEWPDFADVEAIRPQALDMRDLLATAADDDDVPARVVGDLRVGHLHLHVGGIDEAVAWYRDVVGFERVMGMDSASFLSAGGYHHHVAVNTWRGEGVGPRPDDVVGLASWSIVLPDRDELDELKNRLAAAGTSFEMSDDGELITWDPWHIELRASAARDS